MLGGGSEFSQGGLEFAKGGVEFEKGGAWKKVLCIYFDYGLRRGGGLEFAKGGLEFAEGGLEFAEGGLEFAIGYCNRKVIFRL